MALKKYQTVVTKDTLYRIKLLEGGVGLGEALSPRIMARGGTMDLYFADGTTDPASLAEMSLTNTAVTGRAIESITEYMAVTGVATEVVITGIELVEDLGAIS